MVDQPQDMGGLGGNQTINAALLQIIGAINKHNVLSNGVVLATGALGPAKETLYTVPASARVKVAFLSITNMSGGADIPIIYINPGSGSRAIHTGSLADETSIQVISGGTILDLEEGDTIEGECASEMDYVITGTLIPLDQT